MSADVAEFAAAGDGLDPAEGFLDPFPDPLTGGMSRMSGGAPVDRGALTGRVRREVRREPELADIGDEILGVVALVARDASDAVSWPEVARASRAQCHVPRSRSLRSTRCRPATRCDAPSTDARYRRASRRSRWTCGPSALRDPSSTACVCIGAALPMETHLGVPSRRRRRRRSVFGLETLVRRPRLQQRPVDREMITRHVATQLRLGDHRREEPIRDLVIQQAVDGSSRTSSRRTPARRSAGPGTT